MKMNKLSSRDDSTDRHPMLEVNKLHKKYGETEVIRPTDFTIEAGECAVLLGPNGAGKTTIIKMLLDIAKPTSGDIKLLGQANSQMKQHIGYLPQYPTFYSWMTGQELLQFMGRLSLLEADHLDRRMNELLELVGLEKARNKRIGSYSGGMKQRLGIAQALIHAPQLLILDEPVSALDPLGRRDMLELLKEIKQYTTILFSTHILHDAEQLCDKILILHEGKLLLDGKLDQVLQQHQQPVFIIQAPEVERWAPQLAHPEIVQSIEQGAQTARIQVSSIDKGREWLLKVIQRQQIPVQRFELVQEMLEDMFMRMVRK